MTYSVSIKRSALKALERISRNDRLRVIEAIDGLGTQPTAGSVLKGEFAGLRRIRVGVYRVRWVPGSSADSRAGTLPQVATQTLCRSGPRPRTRRRRGWGGCRPQR